MTSKFVEVVRDERISSKWELDIPFEISAPF